MAICNHQADSSLYGTWYLFCWLASTATSMVIHSTECLYRDHVPLYTTNSNSSQSPFAFRLRVVVEIRGLPRLQGSTPVGSWILHQSAWSWVDEYNGTATATPRPSFQLSVSPPRHVKSGSKVTSGSGSRSPTEQVNHGNHPSKK